MPFITDFDITYGSALAPAGFHRATRPDGHPADLNAYAEGGTQAYLWSREGASRTLPIIDVDVVVEDEPVPEGFEKVARNMNKGSSRRAYLCYRRKADKDDPELPLQEVVILYGEEQPGEGFQRLDRPLCLGNGADGKGAAYLAYKRAEDACEEVNGWSADAVKVKDRVDLKDMFGRWLVAEVVEATEETLTLRPKERFVRADEELPRDSPRIAELGKHTSGREAGYSHGGAWSMTEEEMQAVEAKVDDLCKQDPSSKLQLDEAGQRFIRSDLPAFIQSLLSSSLPDDFFGDRICQSLIPVFTLIDRLMNEAGDGPMPSGMLQSMARMLDSDSSIVYFYSHYGHGTYFLDRIEGKERYVALPRASQYGRSTSVYTIVMLDAFVKAEGPSAIINRFAVAPLQELPVYMNVLIKIESMATQALGSRLFPRFQRVATQRLGNLTNEELASLKHGPAQNQDLLENLTKEVDGTLQSWYDREPPADLHRDLETMYLQQAKQLLTCPYLNFRIRGISQISEVIEWACQRERARRSGSSGWYPGRAHHQEPRMTRHHTVASLADWLLEEEVVEVVMGYPPQLKKYKLEDTHYELVRRCENVLGLLANQEKLELVHIQAIWGASLKQADSSQVRVVYKLVEKLCQHVAGEEDMMEFIYQSIKAIPRPYEDYHIELIRSFAEAATVESPSSSPSRKRDYGLELLADTIVGDEHAGLDPELLKATLDAVVMLVKRAQDRTDKLAVYAAKCVDAIKLGVRSVDALQLLLHLIDIVPESRYMISARETMTRDKFAWQLELDFNLVGLIISDLGRYKMQAEARARERGLVGSPALMDACLLSEPRSHRHEVDLRLTFLRYLVMTAGSHFEYDEISQLWDLFVKRRLCADEVEVFLEWLDMLQQPADDDNSQSSPYYSQRYSRRLTPSCLTEDTIKQVFSNLLANPLGPDVVGLDVSELGAKGFDCLTGYFVQVNRWLHFLIQSTSPGGGYLVDNIDLMGFETVWEVCLRARHPAVVDKATKFFIELHLQLSRNSDRRAIWSALVRRCMGRIANELGSPQNGAGSSSQALSQCLVVMKRFLDEVEGMATTDSASLQHSTEMKVRVNVREPGGKACRQLSYAFRKSSVTIGHLKARIAHDTGCRGDLLRLTSIENEVLASPNMDALFLESFAGSSQTQVYNAHLLHRPDDATMEFDLSTPAARSASSSTTGGTDQAYPRTLLSETPSYFDLFFTLLSLPPVATTAWELLNMLPISTSISQRLESLDNTLHLAPQHSSPSSAAPPPPDTPTAVDWAALLDGSSPLRLLYKLGFLSKHVLGVLTSQYAPLEDRSRALHWSLAFIQQGGLGYLLSVLAEWDMADACSSPLHKSALSTLISFIAAFMTSTTHTADLPTPPSPDERSIKGIYRAAARVFAQRDWRALTVRLADVLREVTRSEGPPGGVAALPSSDDDDDDDDSSSSDADRSGHSNTSTTTASGADHAAAPLAMAVAEVVTSAGSGANKAHSSSSLLRASSSSSINASDSSDATAAGPCSTDLFLDADGAGENGELKEEVVVVRNTFKLLLSLSSADGFYSVLLSCLDVATLRTGLLDSHDPHIRRAMAKGIHRLCHVARLRAYPSSSECVPSSFLHLLLDLLPHVPDAHTARPYRACPEYFALLRRLVQDVASSSSSSDDGPSASPQDRRQLIPTLARTLARHLKERQFGETSEDEQDSNLQGLLLTLLTLLRALPRRESLSIKLLVGSSDEEGLIHELVHNCLFAVATTSTGASPLPKCKHHSSVELGLSLVLELCRGCLPNLRQVLEAIGPHHRLGLSVEEKARRRSRAARRALMVSTAASSSSARRGMPALILSQQQSLPLSSTRNRTGYAGLKNLGCTCYMNSTLQQFFMIRGFRHGILSFELDEEEDRDESLMFQLQALFAHLQETHKGYYNPKPFCHALKNWEGEPTDVLVQQDVSEFFNMFFQQVETLTQGTRSENVLRDYFGGTLSHELLADGSRYSERSEPFYYIIVPVRNMKTLDQALEEYISGEQVEYAWESTDADTGSVVKTVLPTIKRQSLKSLPRHLMILLKRFDFDYEVMQQVKINDRLEFPMQLDMFKYTAEGRKDAIQTNSSSAAAAVPSPAESEDGSRQSGGRQHPRDHYRYRLGGIVVHMGTAHSGHYYSYIRERSGKRRWFEFNDTIVTDFNPSDLEAECFGGQETGSSSGGYRAAYTHWSREKIRNAFMLVYDRIDVDRENRKRGDSLRPSVPEPIMSEIHRDNLEYWRKCTILHDRYFDFMRDLLKGSEEEEAGEDERKDEATAAAGAGTAEEEELLLQKVQVATRFVLGTLSEARVEERMMREWIESLVGGYERCGRAREWLLTTLAADAELFREVVVEAETAEARRAASSLVGQVVGMMRGQPQLQSELATALTRSLLSMGDGMAGHARVRNDGYFQLLCTLVQSSPDARAIALNGREAADSKQEEGEGTTSKRSQRSSSYLVELMEIVGSERGSDDARDLTLPAAAAAAASTASPSTPLSSRGGPSTALSLVTTLLLACRIPGCEGEPSPVASVSPLHELTAEEKSVVTSGEFLGRLVRSVKTRQARIDLMPLWTHLLWENEDMSDAAVDAVSSAIRLEDGNALVPVFRAIMAMFDVDDTRRHWRVVSAMPYIINAMETQSKYIRATERSVQMLIRVAKRNEVVRQWLAESAELTTPEHSPSSAAFLGILRSSPSPEWVPRREIRWIGVWLAARDGSSSQDRGMALVKQQRPHGNTAGGNWQVTRQQAAMLQRMLRDFQCLSRGEPLEQCYDSDDEPETLVGKRIRVKWGNEAYVGTVTSYDPKTLKHHVSYEDGDQRDYYLPDRTWDVLHEAPSSDALF